MVVNDAFNGVGKPSTAATVPLHEADRKLVKTQPTGLNQVVKSIFWLMSVAHLYLLWSPVPTNTINGLFKN